MNEEIQRATRNVANALEARDIARAKFENAQTAFSKADHRLREARSALKKVLVEYEMLDEPVTYASLTKAGCSQHG